MLKSKSKKAIFTSNYINDKCVSIQHEDNFQLLKMIVPQKLFTEFNYESTVVNKPKLYCQVLNNYKYTTELVFKYSFEFGNSEEIVVKLYHDAQVAEVVYCTDLQQFIRLLGPKICPRIHSETRASLNVFLNKWLGFLLQNNYSQTHWVRLSKNQNETIEKI